MGRAIQSPRTSMSTLGQTEPGGRSAAAVLHVPLWSHLRALPKLPTRCFWKGRCFCSQHRRQHIKALVHWPITPRRLQALTPTHHLVLMADTAHGTQQLPALNIKPSIKPSIKACSPLHRQQEFWPGHKHHMHEIIVMLTERQQFYCNWYFPGFCFTTVISPQVLCTVKPVNGFRGSLRRRKSNVCCAPEQKGPVKSSTNPMIQSASANVTTIWKAAQSNAENWAPLTGQVLTQPTNPNKLLFAAFIILPLASVFLPAQCPYSTKHKATHLMLWCHLKAKRASQGRERSSDLPDTIRQKTFPTCKNIMKEKATPFSYKTTHTLTAGDAMWCAIELANSSSSQRLFLAFKNARLTPITFWKIVLLFLALTFLHSKHWRFREK